MFSLSWYHKSILRQPMYQCLCDFMYSNKKTSFYEFIAQRKEIMIEILWMVGHTRQFNSFKLLNSKVEIGSNHFINNKTRIISKIHTLVQAHVHSVSKPPANHMMQKLFNNSRNIVLPKISKISAPIKSNNVVKQFNHQSGVLALKIKIP